MRLTRSHSMSRDHASVTPAEVFEEKYNWLLRWAMHFTHSDRGAAEDLVQDAFLRLMVFWPRIKDNLDQLEPFLYSTLRYAYLMESRRERRFSFQHIALIEFDDLRLSLKEEKSADPIEVQDDLRRIVAYLCWRKRWAKSASVLLLRFFHGYFAEEIVRIALMKRSSVDEMLRIARQEVKAYLADPSRVETMGQKQSLDLMPDPMSKRVAVSPEQFAEELRQTIFQARTTPCLDTKELLRRYNATPARPIPCELLAHIVSCERCLQAVHSDNDLSPLSQRMEDGAFGFKRRAPRGSGPVALATRDEIQRSIAGGMQRFRQLYEHHPRGLMVVINGDVVAMRDVNSATSELKVQIGPEKMLGIVNVLSEQGVSLLTLHVTSVPPNAPPELRHEIGLSEDRRLELLLRFTADGAVIEVHYNDPTFLQPASESVELAGLDFEPEEAPEALVMDSVWSQPVADVRPLGRIGERQSGALRAWWKWLQDRMTLMELPEMNPLLATAMICAMATVVLLFLSLRASSVMKPSELLECASVSENTLPQSGASGVVVQTVRIQTPRHKVERMLYRDVQRKRRPREKTQSREEASLRGELESLGIAWNDPLSAGSFRDWHDHIHAARDVVKRPEKGLLRLTTTIAEGSIVSESLTVREADFRPVARTVELRDAGTVEIAELDYSVLPWNSVNPDLFEPVSDAGPVPGRGLHAAMVAHLPRALSEIEVDEAELEARLILSHLNLDGSGRIELGRAEDGVHVRGVVESDKVKRQLESQLRMVPHVVPSILTVQEMASRRSPDAEITSVRQSSVAAEAPSALETYLTQRGMDPAADTSAQEFVDTSFAVKHESEQIAGLLDRFATSTTLSSEARTALSELLVQHKAGLLAALGSEESHLIALRLIPRPAGVPAGVQGSAETLRAAAQHNSAFCLELISGSNVSSRSASVIASQLADSIVEMRAVVLRISAAVQLSSPSHGSFATANQNQ